MTRNLGPMPRAPRKFIRDFDKHGHHRSCMHSIQCEDELYPLGVCTCRELDEDDYQCACEARYDAWKDGDYAEREVSDDE
jgi:hypothetical protein